MSASEKTINTFATRVRQMILKFEDIKHENAELYAMVDERDAKIKELQEKLTQAKHDYDSLKMAKMISVVLISRSRYIWIKFWNNHKSGSPVFLQWKQGTSLVSKGGVRKWDYLTKRIVISAVTK